MSHCRCEWRCPLPRLQQARRVCTTCQTRYIGRHKSFSPATSAAVSRPSVLFLSRLDAFIYSYTNLITRSRVTESRRREAAPQQHPNGFSPELWENGLYYTRSELQFLGWRALVCQPLCRSQGCSQIHPGRS